MRRLRILWTKWNAKVGNSTQYINLGNCSVDANGILKIAYVEYSARATRKYVPKEKSCRGCITGSNMEAIKL